MRSWLVDARLPNYVKLALFSIRVKDVQLRAFLPIESILADDEPATVTTICDGAPKRSMNGIPYALEDGIINHVFIRKADDEQLGVLNYRMMHRSSRSLVGCSDAGGGRRWSAGDRHGSAGGGCGGLRTRPGCHVRA